MSKENKLAQLLLDYSTESKPGERLVIDASVQAKSIVKEIIKEATKRDIFVSLMLSDDEFNQDLIRNQSQNLDLLKKEDDLKNGSYTKMDSYIVIRATGNEFSTAGIDSSVVANWSKAQRGSLVTRLTKKWTLLRWPTLAYAQKAEMNYDDYYEFCLNSMINDYEQMTSDLQPLYDLFMKTDKVRITGPETDLSFSIKDINTKICSGHMNIPDGEVYSAPVIDSVNGTVKYNTYSMQSGKKWENVKLTFENGKIIDAECSNHEKEELLKVFEIDNGAKYVGEFALGVNKNITKPIGDILYDEKIGGSFHFTPGNAYEDADNTNRSSLHWDLVCIQTEQYGGGEIYFDDVLIRKDGKFIIDELTSIN